MSNEEIVSIRERLVRIETTLEHVAGIIEDIQTRRRGSIVLPIAIVVALVEAATNIVGRMIS